VRTPAALFLAGDESSFVSSATFVVDGGLTAGTSPRSDALFAAASFAFVALH
jgi:hypothetical protein